MKILRYNIGLVILLSIAGVQTSTEAEDPPISAEEQPTDTSLSNTFSNLLFIAEYSGQQHELSTLPSTSVAQEVSTVSLVIECLTSETLKSSCLKFCSEVDGVKHAVLPIIGEYVCEEDNIIYTNFSPRISNTIFYMLYISDKRESYFLYWIDEEENNWFNILFVLRFSNAEERKRLLTNQVENTDIVHLSQINVLEDLYFQHVTWNGYLFKPTLIFVNDTMRSAWLELRLALAEAQLLLKKDLKISVYHDTSLSSTSADIGSELMIFSFSSTVRFENDKVIKFSIINYPEANGLTGAILNYTSKSICKATNWLFKSRCTYCYEGTNDDGSWKLFTMPDTTEYNSIAVEKIRSMLTLKLVRKWFQMSNAPNYKCFCPIEGSMQKERHEYLKTGSESYKKQGRTYCLYSGRLQQIRLPSGRVTNGLIIQINNSHDTFNKNRNPAMRTKTDYQFLEDLETSLEILDFRTYFLYGAKFVVNEFYTYWYFELFRVYPNDTRLHKHVISSESVSKINGNIDFYTPYKCPFGSMSYERIFSEENIELIITDNISSTNWLLAVINKVKEKKYIKPIPLVSPLDIEYNGFRTITTGCSVFGIWGEIYDEYWLEVDRLTRNDAELSKSNMLILTGVYGNLVFKETSLNFMLNEYDIKEYQAQMHYLIWRLFISSGTLMFFSTINNIFHYRETENPFLPLEKSLCLGRCEAQNLAYLNKDNEHPYTFCCPYDEIKDLLDSVFDESTKSEIHELKKIVDEEISKEKTYGDIVNPSISKDNLKIGCITSNKNRKLCSLFCLQKYSFDAMSLFPVIENEACKEQKISPEILQDNKADNRIKYKIDNWNIGLHFLHTTQLDNKEIKFIYTPKQKRKSSRNAVYTLGDIDAKGFMEVNIMEDFFVLFKSEEYFIYRPAKIKMHAEAFDAWREVAEKAELVVKRETESVRIQYTLKGEYPATVVSSIPDEGPVYLYLSEEVVLASDKKMIFIILNLSQELLPSLPKPCNSICKSNGFHFRSTLIYCCADNDPSYLLYPTRAKILKMPPDGYEPILAYMTEENTLRIRYKKGQSSSDSMFCAPERTEDSHVHFIMKANDYYTEKNNNEKVCKWPTYYNRVQVPSRNEVSYGIYLQWNYGNHEETQLMKSPRNLLNVKTYFAVNYLPDLPRNIWYTEIFRVLKGKHTNVYRYFSNGLLSANSTTEAGDGYAYNPFDCKFSTLHYEKLLGSDNIERVFKNYSSEEKFLKYMRENGYLSPVAIVPPNEIAYTGWTSFASDECHNFIMWSKIYNESWSLVEKVTANLGNNTNINKIIFTSSYGILTFKHDEDEKNKKKGFKKNNDHFFIHNIRGYELSVPKAVWRLVTLNKKSIAFIVINDIYYYEEDSLSPFNKDDLDIITDCDCTGLGYDNLNHNKDKPFVFCCNASNITKHNMYKDIFSGRHVSDNILRNPN